MMKTSYFLIESDDEDVLDQRDEVFTDMLQLTYIIQKHWQHWAEDTEQNKKYNTKVYKNDQHGPHKYEQ